MKDDGTGQLATALGKLLAVEFGDAFRQLLPDALVPIPMHARRRLSRRADPPVSLATNVGRELGLPVTRNLLRWQRNTSTQLGLSGRGRFRNMHGVMQLRRGYHLDAPHLMLVDDILTTGATCSEAACVLKGAGASQVSVLVVGRTTSA